MPFPMKIQPIDSSTTIELLRNDPVKPAAKSRFKRLFERQFPSVLRSSAAEKAGVGDVHHSTKDGGGSDLDPSSVCLAKMVQSFIEESNEKPAVTSKCGRNRCNCFNRNCSDSSDDELDFFGGSGGFGDSGTTSSGDACEFLKSLVSCTAIAERNLLADTAKLVETNKICKGKDDCRTIVVQGLLGLGYDASICKSRWEKSPSYPAGEHEYIDAIVDGERLLVDVDFRSEFEIARSTKNYRAILQSLPSIFVGKPDRIQQIVSIVSEAAKQSLKKKGMHFPPWRKAEYMRAKWLSSYTRITAPPPSMKTLPQITTTTAEEASNLIKSAESKPSLMTTTSSTTTTTTKTPPPTPVNPTESFNKIENQSSEISSNSFSGDFELIFGERSPSSTPSSHAGTSPIQFRSVPAGSHCGELDIKIVMSPWQLPAIKPKNHQRGAKVVTGLASILKEKP